MTPPRLTILAGQLGLGGAEQQLFYLLQGLDRDKWVPAVINAGRPDDYWVERIAALGVPVLTIRRSGGRAARLARVVAAAHQFAPDIVHAWVWHLNPYAVAAGRVLGASRIGSMRESFHGLPPSRVLRALAYRGLDALVVNSSAAATEVAARRLVAGPIRVVPNGVLVPTSAGRRSDLRAHFGIGSEDRVVGTIGRLVPVKNHGLLIDAMARLVPKWNGLKILIIGDGPCRSDLVSRAQAAGLGERLMLPGALPHAAEWLPALDVFCLTSTSEGTPNTALEALAARVPVVGTSCVGEVVENGRSGVVIQDASPEALAAAVAALLGDETRALAMATAGYERVVRTFSVPAMIETMTCVYRDVLDAKAA